MNNGREHHHHHHCGEATGRILWLATGLTLGYAGVEAGAGGGRDRWRWSRTPATCSTMPPRWH
jgi:hypothetical protein